MQKNRHHSPYMTQAFKPSAWLANIDFVKRLITNTSLLIVVMTESAGGKSTFVDLLRLKLESTVRTILLSAGEGEKGAGLIEELTTLLPASSSQDIRTFEQFFAQLEMQSPPVLIIIDDAQRLPFDCLKQIGLAYQHHGIQKRVHICLASDFSLTPALHQLEQVGLKHFIHTIEPGALTESEARTYVLKYFQGKKGLAGLFQPGRFKTFYTTTQGQIAAMNEHLRIFIANQEQKQDRFTVILKKLTVLPLMLVGLLVGMGGGLHWWMHHAVLPLKLTASQPVLYHSLIPAWYVYAKIEPIAPPPLQKYAQANLEAIDAEQVNPNLVLRDKVVVIPDVRK